MLKLTKRIALNFSFKDRVNKSISQFLTFQAEAVVRNTPSQKQRKYKNIEIAQDFKKIDNERKKQRYQKIKQRQILLQQKLKNEQELLTSSQSDQIKTEIAKIEQIIKSSTNQIQILDSEIQKHEADYMLIEGPMKLSVLNHIKHLQYLSRHNAGAVLHPETIKILENVHYCVNHNLPVKRINLYEIMPEYFEAEIGELQSSIQKLIYEKQLLQVDEQSTSSIRFFNRYSRTVREILQGQNASRVQQQMRLTFANFSDHCLKLLEPHAEYLEKVAKKMTPFRGIEHMMGVMQSDMPIKYLPEEQAMRQTIFQIIKLKSEWINYESQCKKRIFALQTRYVEPPPYIKNHPILNQKYKQVMQKIMNPVVQEQNSLIQTGDQTEVQLGMQMQQQIRQIVRDKYDPIFIQAMNNDRSLIDNQKLEIQFYNLSTNILQKLNLLQQNEKDQQLFQKTAKKQKPLLAQKKKNLIKHNQLTRIVYLNNQNKDKYNLQFFAKWFDIDKEELRHLLRYVSYLRVPVQVEAKEIKMQIIKFVG